MAKEEELRLLKSNENKSCSSSTDGSLSQSSETPEVGTKHLRKSGRWKRNPPQMQSHAMKQAEKLRANLDPQIPTFIKYMLPTCVSICFFMGFSWEFGKSYLPRYDVTIILITEDGKEYPVKYLYGRSCLSAGWKSFSLLHKLVEGDVLVFHLIEATKFKVYIIRKNVLAEDGDTLPIIDLCPCGRQIDPGNIIKTKEFQCNLKSGPAPKKLKPVAASNLDEGRSTSPTISCQAGDNDEEVDLEVKEGIRFSKSLKFKDVKALENFTVMVNGLVTDSEIPKDVMTKYYYLRCSQNAFLHDQLPKFVSSKLVAAIISETVNIADAIAASKLTTSANVFTIWSKSLVAFQQIGMNVGFLHSRVQRLMYLASASEQARDLKGEALLRQTQVEEEIRDTELKLSESRETSKRFEEIETLKAEQHELNFHTEASAQW